MGPPNEPRPGWVPGRGGSADASDVTQESSTPLDLPLRPGWRIPMVLAYRIGRMPPPLKPAAARCWRVAVQAALGQEART